MAFDVWSAVRPQKQVLEACWAQQHRAAAAAQCNINTTQALPAAACLQVRSFKPDPEIYAAAEDITQLAGGDLVFIDDRPENAAAAAARGWHAIHHTSPEETLRQLGGLGLPVVEL